MNEKVFAEFLESLNSHKNTRSRHIMAIAAIVDLTYRLESNSPKVKTLIEDIRREGFAARDELKRKRPFCKVVDLEERYIRIRSLGRALCQIVAPAEVVLYELRLGS